MGVCAICALNFELGKWGYVRDMCFELALKFTKDTQNGLNDIYKPREMSLLIK